MVVWLSDYDTEATRDDEHLSPRILSGRSDMGKLVDSYGCTSKDIFDSFDILDAYQIWALSELGRNTFARWWHPRLKSPDKHDHNRTTGSDTKFRIPGKGQGSGTRRECVVHNVTHTDILNFLGARAPLLAALLACSSVQWHPKLHSKETSIAKELNRI